MTEEATTQSSRHAEPLLSVRGLGVRWRDRWLLQDVDLDIHGGQIVTVIGLNGAGKTTLVKALLGLIGIDRGEVRRRPGLRFGYVPQHLHREISVPVTVRRFLRCSGKVAVRPDDFLVRRLGLAALLDVSLWQLSGGEMSRVLLARAMLGAPDVLVLDEPLTGVDVNGQAELYRLLGEVRDRFRCGVLLVSHDLHVVMADADKVICLNKHVCCTGTPQAVARHAAFTELFGVEAAQMLAVYTHHHDHQHRLVGGGAPASPTAGEVGDDR